MQHNILFLDIRVLTPDENGGIVDLEHAMVGVAGSSIVYVGQDRQEAEQALIGKPVQIYNGAGKLLWPAMANTHCHIPMTLFRNQTDDYNLHDWLFQKIFPREANLTRDHVYNGALLGLAEMIRHGTGAAADMYYFSDAVAQAAMESGFRLNVCCDGKTSGDDGNAHVDIGLLREFKSRWQTDDGMVKTALLVHSVYLYEDYLYRELSEAAAELGIHIQVHVSETKREVEDCIQKYGCRPPQQLDRFGLFNGPAIAAHCVHLDDSDRLLLKQRNVAVAHNPTSNLKLGSGIADVRAMLDHGICVSLGTDGAASNNNLNLYQEMKLAGLLAKGIHADASCLPAADLVRMATVNGMKSLGFPKSGRIEPGWFADLQIMDVEHPAMCPLGNADAALVYSSDSGYVESVMVNGRWLMEKHVLKTIDEEKAMAEAKWSAQQLAIH